MKTIISAALLSTSLFLSGCGSPSNGNFHAADFSGAKTYKKNQGPVPQLTEADVLGLKNGSSITDAEIRGVLQETRNFKVPENSTLLLIQSGSEQPDAAMIDQLAGHFRVITHTGVPSDLENDDKGGGKLSKELRLAAAQAGAETLLVYWGNLELKRNDLPTGIVSWVPVVDFVVPDEYQRVRMSLKIALIDVRTGHWAAFRTEPIENDLVSTRYARDHNSAWPLEMVKKKLYEAAVRDLIRGYLASL